MRQSQLIVSNAAIIWATRILLMVPQLVLVPYLIGTIGETGYGVYSLVWSLLMSIEQLQMSLQSGVVKYSAGFLALGRMDEVNSVVSSSFVYSLLLAVLACAGTLFVAVSYYGPADRIGYALVVVGIMALFIFPLTPYIAVIQSRQCYYIGAIAETVTKYVSVFAVVMWFHMVGPSVEALIIIMAGMMFLFRLAQVPFAYRLIPGLRNRLHLFDAKTFRLIAVFGGATVLASVCLAVNSTGVRWLMDRLTSTSFVAHMAIMLMPGLLLSQIIGAVTITVMPATSAYEASGNQRMLQELMIRGMRYSTILVLAGLLPAGLLMRSVMSAWVGSDYEFLALPALLLFASGSFMLSTSVAHHILKGLGKLRVIVAIYCFGLVIVPICLILTVFHVWHNPYVAVTVGLSAGHVICGCLQIGFCTKAVHAGLRGLFMHAYVQPLMVATIVCIVVFGISAISKIDSLVGLICVALSAVLLFFYGCYFFIASVVERKQIKGVIQSVKNMVVQSRSMFHVS